MVGTAFGAGIRANCENSSTSPFNDSTSLTIVAVHSSTKARVATGALEKWRLIRSADNWIGVSGFLISCASRRATSRHAATFCDRISGVTSSNTRTVPSARPPSPTRGVAIAARCSSRPSRTSATSCGGVEAPRRCRLRQERCQWRKVVAREDIRRRPADGLGPNTEQAARRPVHRADDAGRIERDDARTDALEDRLDVAAPALAFEVLALDIAGGPLELAPALGEFARHAVERLDQRAELVLGLRLDAVIQVTGANLARGRRQQLHGAGDALCEVQAHPRRAN